MRGKHARSIEITYNPGITPADAGKTNIVRYSVHGHEDHPRGCGENAETPTVPPKVGGSPPRMRGKPNAKAREVAKFRITPADAGKTLKLRPSRQKSGDHPRGCGENNVFVMMVWITLGSPPRMRGKLPTLHLLKLHNGITPADAGKTLAFGFYQTRRWDHPRGCGENQAFPLFLACPLGSPPQVRGKL